MDKVSPLLELVALVRKDEKELIKDIGLNQVAENKKAQSVDLRYEIEEVIKDEEEVQEKEKEEEDEEDEDEEEEEEEDDEEEEEDEEEDVYKDLLLQPKVISWLDQAWGETLHGIQVQNVGLSTDCKRDEFERCPMCLEPFTLDKIHQMSCLPCGHIYGMSCIKEWMEGRSADKCYECYKQYSLESVRILYATSICIPTSAQQEASVGRFSFSKRGFTIFKKYELLLRTDALNNRSNALKQRADVLERRAHAIKQRTELLKRIADAEKRADVLERQNEAMKRQRKLLNRMTHKEEWAEASEQQADAEKRAEVLRRKAGAWGQCADEYLRKAGAYGKQAKALRQQAKSLRQLADSYLASRKFFIQSYKEFLGLQCKEVTL